MCLAIPAIVTSIKGLKATVSVNGQELPAIATEEVKVGDMVQLQMGMIVKVLTPEEAASMTSAYKEMDS